MSVTPLHAAAEELLDRLTERYTVERRETGGGAGRTVRLIPRTPAAAPVAVTFTDDAGLVLRFGRWYTHVVPSGTDLDECVEDLREQVAATVEGGLWEGVRRAPRPAFRARPACRDGRAGRARGAVRVCRSAGSCRR